MEILAAPKEKITVKYRTILRPLSSIFVIEAGLGIPFSPHPNPSPMTQRGNYDKAKHRNPGKVRNPPHRRLERRHHWGIRNSKFEALPRGGIIFPDRLQEEINT
uniref:Uncharacterized protein n=1 Tax=Candidatus Kentrum sp. TC TaxID=2126339 RepID=A0A451A1W2_9GAMM|nr:MAG: hypothetical protein BECKTC1821F_GA0114240_103916 [Candidatus Kentron sp. TC]